MPVDATGAATTKFGIPKYATGADAPSGKGLNNIMDSLDTILSNLGIASPVANDVPVYDSVAGKWKKASGTPSASTFLRGDGAWAGAYTTYTPTLTGSTGGGATLGNASPVVARYLQIGKMVHCYGLVTQGTTTNYGTGTLLVALPVTAANNACQGSGTAYHNATGAQYLSSPSLTDTTHMQLLIPNGYGGASAAVSGSGNYPWAWGVLDNFTWNLTYEAA